MLNTRKFDVDVLVAGGGVAGVSAALTAARSGLRTLILENSISLGGLATNGYVTGVAGMIEGNCKEWLDRMEAEGYLFRRPHTPSIEPERGKIVLESMLLEAGARILYGVYVIDAAVENGRIKELICHTKSGRMTVSARIFVDATGDADVAAYAGVPYEVGSPGVCGAEHVHHAGFQNGECEPAAYGEAIQDWRKKETAGGKVPSKMSVISELEEKAVKNGDLPFFIFPTALMYTVPNTAQEDADVCVMTTHSFHTRNTDVEDLTRQIIEQHQQIILMEKFFRKYVPGFEKSRVTGLANMHGIRDSRRIVGEYVLKDEDVVCARKFEDGIAKFPEFFDTHHPTSAEAGVHAARASGRAQSSRRVPARRMLQRHASLR